MELNSTNHNYRSLIKESFTYSIGDSYAGGTIAYIFQPGDSGYTQWTGFVACDDPYYITNQWGPYGDQGTTTELGAGFTNTPLITSGSGAQIIGLTSGGFSDWKFPSKDELNKMYINRVAIGNFLTTSAFGVAYSTYWSSSEWSGNPGNIAWSQYFFDGTQFGSGGYVKASTLRARAIRYF